MLFTGSYGFVGSINLIGINPARHLQAPVDISSKENNVTSQAYSVGC